MDNQSSALPAPESPRVQNSGLATATLVLGILGLLSCGLMTIPAVICGVIALVKIGRAKGTLSGKRQVVVGLIIASIGLLIGLMIGLMLPLLGRAREPARRANCYSNLREIGFAIAMYADGHDGKIPWGFDDLRPYCGAAFDRLLICPSAKDTNSPSYQILLGGQKWNSPETTNAIVVTEPLSNHRYGRNALYGDGHVSWVPDRPDSQ